ncbi:MAG: hypothetical protein ACREX8_19765, partial [Gammaproteobacteria bacterium]
AQSLAKRDHEMYRRALTATAGRANRGQGSDVQRTKLALERLAEGDPALPLNSLGRYVELTELDPQPDHITLDRPAPTRTVRGIVVEVKLAPLNRLTVIIERDVPSITGAERARQDFPIDATVPLLDPTTRPSLEERQAAAAAIRPAIEAHQRALDALIGAPARADVAEQVAEPDPAPADADPPPFDSQLSEPDTADHSVAQHWSALVAKTAEHGFIVQTTYTGESSVNAEARTIAIAFDQSPLDRVVELAQFVGAVAIQQAGVESTPAQPIPPDNSATEPTAPSEWIATTDTPIYEALCREMGQVIAPHDSFRQLPPELTRTAAELNVPLVTGLDSPVWHDVRRYHDAG